MHSGVGTKASPLGSSRLGTPALAQTLSDFPSPTLQCIEPWRRRPRFRPRVSTAALPLPRSCQRPAGLTVPVGLARRPSEPAQPDAPATPSGAERPGQARRQMGAEAPLTRQRLLRPRQQHSRRPPAPSSAAALASAAAINRPCGAANRHNRRRRAAEYPARPGGMGVGRSRRSGPSARLRAGTRVRRPRHWELDRAGSRPPWGLLLSTRPFRRRARRETASRGRGDSGVCADPEVAGLPGRARLGQPA